MTDDMDIDEELPEIKISGGATKTLNALLASAEDYAFLGSAHPEAQDEIEARYHRLVRSMCRLINRLETNQK